MENYQILNFANVAAYSVAILGLMIIIGYSGQVSIGQSFFFGLGAYVTAWLGVDHGWNFLLTLPVSAALGFAIGFLVGIPALRIRGLYLALVTLALAAVFPVLAKLQALESITGGANGKPADTIVWKPPDWTPGSLTNQGWQFLVLCRDRGGHVPARVEHDEEPPGRSLIALRDSEVGAAVSGVWPAGGRSARSRSARRTARSAGRCSCSSHASPRQRRVALPPPSRFSPERCSAASARSLGQ